MDSKSLAPENIRELQIWLNGKFDLVAASQQTCVDDIKAVRGRVHDLSNDVAKGNAQLISLTGVEKIVAEHDVAIETLIKHDAERTGAIAVIKTIYGVGGAVVGVIVTVALELAKVIHP